MSNGNYRENYDIVLTFWDHVFWAESLFNGEEMENISIQSNKKGFALLL